MLFCLIYSLCFDNIVAATFTPIKQNLKKTQSKRSFSFSLTQEHLQSTRTCTHILPQPVLRTRSRRSGVLGMGLRASRGERVLGVEAGEFGSGGRSGGG